MKKEVRGAEPNKRNCPMSKRMLKLILISIQCNFDFERNDMIVNIRYL